MSHKLEHQVHSVNYIDDTRLEWWDADFLRFAIGSKASLTPESVCDLGCGAGHWGMSLAQIFDSKPHYTGVDYEPHWVDCVENSKSLRQCFSNVQSFQSDAASLGLPDQSFDLVTCQTLLMHVPDPEAVIDEMIRVCKPNGHILIAEPSNLINRAQIFESIHLLKPSEAANLMEVWMSYHHICATHQKVNYDIALSLPDIFENMGIKKYWSLHNPKTNLMRHFQDSDLMPEYTPENYDIVTQSGISMDKWQLAQQSVKQILAYRDQGRISCGMSGLFLFGFEKS
jgi:ubiquinone/menaquinone biosynthesis C-methylase UbiE